MGCWTYVIGSICIETYTDDKIKAIAKVEEFLLTAPIISGSENDVQITVINHPRPFKDTSLVLLNLFGELRDRYIEPTEDEEEICTTEELKLFIEALKKEFKIEFMSIKVYGDYGSHEEITF